MQIKEEKYYSLSEVARHKMVPFATSYPTLRMLVQQDSNKPEEERIINALILGEGKGTTIRVKGSDLIKFIKTKNGKTSTHS